MPENHELEQEFHYYAKLSDCNAIINYVTSLFKVEELLGFMAEDDSKDLLGIGRVGSEIVGVARDLLMNLLGPVTEETGLLWGNKVKYFRVLQDQQIKRLLEKTVESLQQQRIQPQPVKMEVLVPLFEYSSLLEENDELNGRWVELLTAAASGVVIPKDYPFILSQLGTIEVQILEYFYRVVTEQEIKLEELSSKGFSLKHLEKKFGISNEICLDTADRLFRLRLCIPTSFSTLRTGIGKAIDKVSENISVGTDKPYGLLSLTPSGYRFIKACRLKTSDPI